MPTCCHCGLLYFLRPCPTSLEQSFSIGKSARITSPISSCREPCDVHHREPGAQFSIFSTLSHSQPWPYSGEDDSSGAVTQRESERVPVGRLQDFCSSLLTSDQPEEKNYAWSPIRKIRWAPFSASLKKYGRHSKNLFLISSLVHVTGNWSLP